jgi:hypothetical protein
MAETLERHLTDALAALLHAREALRAEAAIERREVIQRELATASTSIGRALLLIGGGS